jgi:hypothetical protein
VIDADPKKLSSLKEKDHQLYKLGKKLMLILSQKTGTGETLMEPTSCHGTRTNISQSTVDHAGLKEPPQLLLIDSTSYKETRPQHQLLLMLKLLLTAELVDHAMVETQLVYMNMLWMKVSQTHHVNNTSLIT